MKAIPIMAAGSADTLKIQDFPDPKLMDDEVLIDVKAFGLNFADLMARKGQYPDAPPIPFVPGYEVAGTVKQVGPKVTNFKEGERVFALTNFGGYASLAPASHMACFHLPDNMTFSEGASIPVNFVTAYHCINQTGTLVPGSKILIQAAAGGVGMAAIQFAKLAGLEIFGTAGSQAKLDMIKDLGVHHPINYLTSDFETEVMRITNNQGIDIILDSMAGSNIKKSINILRAHGRVVAFGASAFSDREGLNALKLIPEFLSMMTINPINLLKDSKGLYGVNMLKVARERPDLLNLFLNDILKLFAENKLKTFVTKEYPWEQTGQAHKDMETRKTTGKVILTIP
jgi:NADPH:quinone reductase-like Zn-dependent oxidoreductase